MAEATPSEVAAKADAAFATGFGDTPPAPAEKVVVETPAEPAKPEPAVAAPVVVPEKPQYVRLTKQEWDNTKAAAGKVSSLESQVARLVSSQPKAEQLAQQILEQVRSQLGSGQKLRMPEKALAKLGGNYPDLADDLRADLQEIFDAQSPTSDATPPAPTVDVKAEIREFLRTEELNKLEKTYPTWKEIVAPVNVLAGERPPEDNPFRQWLAAQPADYQREINDTHSPAELQGAIARFMEDSTKSNTATPGKPDKAAARRAVIEDAVTPRADGNPPPPNPQESAEEAFGKWYKKTRH